MPASEVTLRDVFRARQRVAPVVRRTPLVSAPYPSRSSGGQVWLKLENLQRTGSFKIRGAANKLLSLPEEVRGRGVITVSSGNHGRAVSYVARELSVPATIVLPATVPENKRKAIRSLGADLVEGGATYDEATDFALRLQKERNLTFVHPFDDPLVIAGQGTIGLELLEDLPEIDTAIVPLSGGGLIAGIALALKAADPAIRVVGVTMEGGPAMIDSLRAGEVVEIIEEPTLADALAGGLGPDNQYTFRMAQAYIDDTALVTEEEIAGAMAFALEEHQLVVEGGGAVGIAALLYDKVKPGQRTAVVVSGGNVDLPVLLEVAQKQSAPSNQPPAST